jgi:hypothetical protein
MPKTRKETPLKLCKCLTLCRQNSARKKEYEIQHNPSTLNHETGKKTQETGFKTLRIDFMKAEEQFFESQNHE